MSQLAEEYKKNCQSLITHCSEKRYQAALNCYQTILSSHKNQFQNDPNKKTILWNCLIAAYYTSFDQKELSNKQKLLNKALEFASAFKKLSHPDDKIDLNIVSAEVLIELGRIEFELGSHAHDQTVERYKEARRLLQNIDHPPAKNSLEHLDYYEQQVERYNLCYKGDEELENKDYKKAIAYHKQALDIQNQYIQYLSADSNKEYKNADYFLALKIGADIYYNLGASAHELNQLDQALEYFKMAAEKYEFLVAEDRELSETYKSDLNITTKDIRSIKEALKTDKRKECHDQLHPESTNKRSKHPFFSQPTAVTTTTTTTTSQRELAFSDQDFNTMTISDLSSYLEELNEIKNSLEIQYQEKLIVQTQQLQSSITTLSQLVNEHNIELNNLDVPSVDHSQMANGELENLVIRLKQYRENIENQFKEKLLNNVQQMTFKIERLIKIQEEKLPQLDISSYRNLTASDDITKMDPFALASYMNNLKTSYGKLDQTIKQEVIKQIKCMQQETVKLNNKLGTNEQTNTMGLRR